MLTNRKAAGAAVVAVAVAFSGFSEAALARGSYYRSAPRYRAPPPVKRVAPSRPISPPRLSPRQAIPRSVPKVSATPKSSAPAANRQSLGAAATPSGPKSPKNFVTPTNPPTRPSIPPGHVAEPSRSGNGTVYRAPGSKGDANTVRVMGPTKEYPSGYSVHYNKEGHAINPATGKQGSGPAETHVPLPANGK